MKAEDVLKNIAAAIKANGASSDWLVWQLTAYTLLQAGWQRCPGCDVWTEPGKVPGYPCGCINPFPND
jgi:hypothetical protein